jgi:hypothetical protein
MVLKNSLPKQPETDYSACGIAAAQIFAGEDNDKYIRVKSQMDAMRKGINDQSEERERMRQAEREEEMLWAAHVRETSIIREDAENRELEFMRARKAAVAAENKVLAEEQRSKYRPRQFVHDSEATSLAAFNSEDLTKAIDEYGRIKRRDMFKGFTAAQRRKIMQDNEVIIKMRREALRSERKESESWALAQLAQARAMEQVLYEERRLKDEAMSDQMDTLSLQMEEAAERKRVYNKNHFGGIGDEFFDKFGRDCR